MDFATCVVSVSQAYKLKCTAQISYFKVYQRYKIKFKFAIRNCGFGKMQSPASDENPTLFIHSWVEIS